MAIGDQIKVFLPGESPWAEVVEEADGMVKGRILNKLFHEHTPEQQAEFTGREFGTAEPLKKLYDFKQGDEVWFERGEHNEWVPAPNQAAS